MKTILLTLSLTLFYQGPGHTEENRRFAQLLRQAQENNYQLKIQYNNIAIESIAKDLKFRELYFPVVDWSLYAEDQSSKGGPLTNAHALTSDPLVYSSELSLSYNLFNGLKDYNALLSARSRHSLEKKKHTKEQEEITFSLKTLSFDLSLEINKIKILQEQLAHAKSLKQTATIRYQKGLIPKVDLERSRLEFLNNSDQLIVQKERVKSVKLEMSKLIQLDKILAQEFIDLPYLELEKKITVELNKMKKRGIDHAVDDLFNDYLHAGIDLAVLKNQLEIADYEVQVAKAGHYPRLNFKIAHRLDFHGNYRRHKDDNYTFSMLLTFPIINNFEIQSAVKQEKLRHLNAQYEFRENKFQAKIDIQQICQKLLSLHASFVVAKQKVQLREQVYQSALARFKRGSIPIQDLITDKLDLQNESFSLATTINDIRKFFLSLQKITGKLSTTGV